MSKNYNYFKREEQELKKWLELCPVGEYRVLSMQEMLNFGLLPRDLVMKFNSVFVAVSGVYNSDEIFIMFNGNRIDFPATQVDQQPFGFGYYGGEIYGSGVLIQHGDWDGRSSDSPPEFWNSISVSGLYNVYPLNEMPPSSSGSFEDLNIQSQKDAFGNLINHIHNNFEHPNL